MLFLLIMRIDFLLQNNVILLRLESLNEWFVLYDLSSVLKFMQGIYSFFNIQRIKSNSLPYEDFIPFELYLFTNALIYDILANFLCFFLIHCNCCSVQNAFIIKTDGIYFCLLVFYPIFVMKKLGQSNIKSPFQKFLNNLIYLIITLS